MKKYVILYIRYVYLFTEYRYSQNSERTIGDEENTHLSLYTDAQMESGCFCFVEDVKSDGG